MARAESLASDPSARAFRRSIAGKQAYARAGHDLKQGRLDAARSELLGLLATHPGDVPGRRMLATVEESLSERRRRR